MSVFYTVVVVMCVCLDDDDDALLIEKTLTRNCCYDLMPHSCKLVLLDARLEVAFVFQLKHQFTIVSRVSFDKMFVVINAM